MISRREFLKLGAASSAATFVATRARFLHNVLAAQSPQVPLAGSLMVLLGIPLMVGYSLISARVFAARAGQPVSS